MMDGVLRCAVETHNPSIHCHLKATSILLSSRWIYSIFSLFPRTQNRTSDVFEMKWHQMTLHYIHLCLGLLFFRNTKLISFLPRRGQTAASDTTAQWKYWPWTAIWLVWYGYQTPSSETPRMQIPTGLQCPTSCSEYGTTGRYFTP